MAPYFKTSQVAIINVDLIAPCDLVKPGLSLSAPFLSLFLSPQDCYMLDVSVTHYGRWLPAVQLPLRFHRKMKTMHQKENKLTRLHQTFTEGTEQATHWAQLCPCQNQINKVKIKRKKGTEQGHSLIRVQLGNLKSISALTCWHSASGRWNDFHHAHANWFFFSTLQFCVVCHPKFIQHTPRFWGFWISCFGHNVFIVFPRLARGVQEKWEINWVWTLTEIETSCSKWSCCTLRVT